MQNFPQQVLGQRDAVKTKEYNIRILHTSFLDKRRKPRNLCCIHYMIIVCKYSLAGDNRSQTLELK
jgi:hypothetical protein